MDKHGLLVRDMDDDDRQHGDGRPMDVHFSIYPGIRAATVSSAEPGTVPTDPKTDW